jgi:hypothetical protein
MSYLSILVGLIQFVNKLTDLFYQKGLLDRGGLTEVQKIVGAQNDDLKKTLGIIDAAGKRFDNGLPADMEYRDKAPGSTVRKG